MSRLRKRAGHAGVHVHDGPDAIRRGRGSAWILRTRIGCRVLLMRTTTVPVLVFAAPDASCAPGHTWRGITAFVGARLRHRFGDQVSVEHVELFSARSFEFPDALAAIQRGASLPMVMVDGRLVSSGGKLSERAIAHAVETVLEDGNTEKEQR